MEYMSERAPKALKHKFSILVIGWLSAAIHSEKSASGETLGQGILEVVHFTMVTCLLDVSGYFKHSGLSD